MNAVDTLTSLIKSAEVGFAPDLKSLRTLLALMILEGLTATVALPELAEADE